MKPSNGSRFFRPSISRSLLWGCFIACLLLWVLLGNGVAFSDEQASPERIIVFPLYAEEILYDLVGVDRIVYVGHQQIEDESYSPIIKCVSHIPGANWQNTGECELLELDPDLIVLEDDLMSDYAVIFPSLTQKGVRFLFVHEPESIDEIESLILQIGDVVGEPERAHEMVLNLEEELEDIAHFVDHVHMSKCSSAAYVGEYYPYPLWDDVVGAVGIAPLSYEHMCYFDNIEVLENWNPDIILYDPYVFDTDGSLLPVEQGYVSNDASLIANDPKLAIISAVQEGNIFPLRIHSSHYVVDSIRDLLRYMNNGHPNPDQ